MGWGVTIPAGESPHVGIGGHVMGGAFGFLCREHGLAADHLYGVEVVVTDAKGMAKSVVATREPSDPNRELWWAHTGGGGGNFGIVTRYWFRSPDATGTDPARLLPRAPQSVVSFRAEWSWKDVDESAFSKLVRNYGAWCERNSEAESPYAKLFSALSLGRRQRGTIEVRGVLTAGADAQRLLDEHLAAINDGVGVRYTRQVVRNNWLEFALAPFSDLFATRPSGVGAQKPSFKLKDAFLRKRHTDRQIGVAYDYLTRDDHDVAGGMLGHHHVVLGWLGKAAGRSAEPDVAAPLLPRRLRRHRRGSRAGRSLQRRADQPSGCRLCGPGVEHIGRAVAPAVLQGQLPPAPARQSAMGSPQRVPARLVHPTLTIASDR
jgi:hypothetical protein